MPTDYNKYGNIYTAGLLKGPDDDWGIAFGPDGTFKLVLNPFGSSPVEVLSATASGVLSAVLAAGTATRIGGVLTVNTTHVGNVGGGTDDLITYTLPAGTLSTDGQTVRVYAWGTTAANGNNKTVTLNFGATSIGNIVNGALNNGVWGVTGYIVRTGAATQECVFSSSDTLGNNAVTRNANSSETLSDAVVIKCTGTSAASATDDVIQHGMIVELIN